MFYNYPTTFEFILFAELHKNFKSVLIEFLFLILYHLKNKFVVAH